MTDSDQQRDPKALLISSQRVLLRRIKWAGIALMVLLVALLGGYQIAARKSAALLIGSRDLASSQGGGLGGAGLDVAALAGQINPPQGYRLPARYGDLGPRLLAGGVIDYGAFAAIYQDAGSPLTSTQVAILKQGSDEPIVINRANAHFLLNLFWAVGLANKNKILTDGPMVENSNGHIESFASTGGWGLATKPVGEVYASLDLIPLTPEQQSRVEEVASAVYRPCCNNPTLFPDCNHGMAMLGLLELMASQGASADEMFAAAKYVNAFWFPQQTLETAIYLEASQGVDFDHADARQVVGRDFASGSGAATVHQAVEQGGLFPQAPGQQNSCSN